MTFKPIKVDRDKLEERIKKRDFTIPYYELLDPTKEDERERQVEFLKNSEDSPIWGNLHSDLYYEILVGCMEIYTKTGENYFYDYQNLSTMIQHTTLDKGIKHYDSSLRQLYIEDISYLDSYRKDVLEVVELMKFFGIESVYDTTIEDYMNYYNNAENEWYEMRYEEIEKRKARSEALVEDIKDIYFNFDNFDNDKFNKIFKECIKDMDMGKNLYTLDEVININVNLGANKTFIVFLRKNDKVCFVGRTTNLLNYIGSKSKEYDADRVAFYPVDNDYIDDIYIRSIIQFDIPTGQVRNTNRKYISLTSAKRIFKELYKINLTHIKKIIAKYDLERFMIGDVIVLDKIELHKAVKDYLNLK